MMTSQSIIILDPFITLLALKITVITTHLVSLFAIEIGHSLYSDDDISPTILL